MRALERYLILQIIDQRWREHLYDMDYLREGIHLRGFAQIEPLVAYKNEAFELFRDLMNSIWGDFGRMIFHVEVTIEGDEQPEPPVARRPSSRSSSSTGGNRNVTYSGGRRRGVAAPGRAAPRRRERAARAQRSVLVRVGQEVQKMPRGVAFGHARFLRPSRLRPAA
jgi:preprotein translocase subunit SecA